MKINTKFFGEIEIENTNVLKFSHGIPGFETLKKYAILEIEDHQYLKCLQSIEERDVCLLIASPWDYIKEYEVKIPTEDLEEMEITSENDINIYSVIRINEKILTANLIAPIIINLKKGIGKTDNFAKLKLHGKAGNSMLVISRKAGESIIIGDNIEVTILEISDGSIKLGIEAPKNIKLLRKELLEAVGNENLESSKSIEGIFKLTNKK